MADDHERCDCSCHRCCVPLDASCEDCEEEHVEPAPTGGETDR